MFVPIDVVSNPSLLSFKDKYLSKQIPVLVRNCVDDWPAVEKWKSLDYLSSIMGRRHVPIEIGNIQQLMFLICNILDY
jgi:hypothetical protein